MSCLGLTVFCQEKFLGEGEDLKTGIIWDIIWDILRFGLLFGGGLVLLPVLMREKEAHIFASNFIIFILL